MAKAKEKTKTSTKTFIQLRLSETEACALRLLLEDLANETDDDGNETSSDLYDALADIDMALSKAGIRPTEWSGDVFKFEDGLIQVIGGSTVTRSKS